MIILRCFTLVGNLLPEPKIVKIAITLLFMTFYGFNSAQTASIEETKKQANKLFEEEDYTPAYKLFSQLVSNYPKDVDLNYKLGVCMIYSEPDKKKCIPYLQFSNSKPDEASKETKFYLGKAYHINYRFDEAIKFYNEYKKIGSGNNQKKLQVDREIRGCGYGKRLLSNLSDLVVLNKKQLNEADYFRSYDLKNIGGKLLKKPEEFKTVSDKRKKDKSVVFLPRNGERVYFSSYGDNADDGKDIYFRIKLPNGEYSEPEKVKGINTEFDEDYPFLHPNGNVLYFASKGHNSMGGYDIFKSNYVKETDSWTLPQNLEFPINSPDDDYLYVTDSLEKIAYFSTGRQSPPGKIDVLKVNTERKPIDVMALKGTVVKESAGQSLKSKITVKNISSGEIVGTYNAQDNGDYFMDLPNGAKLVYTVETPGLETQSQGINLPLVSTSKPFKQIISYDKGILKIINYFDEATTDDSYLQYLKIIENKAKLDVNDGKNNLSPTLLENNVATNTENNSNTNENKNPTVTDGGTSAATSNTNAIATNTKTNVSNKELSIIAKQDAEDSKKEALQFNQDANDAFEIGKSKQIIADTKIKEGDEALKNAQAITNEDEKKSAIEKAIAIKTEGENEKVVAEKILTFAKTLDDDAKVKIKEADLNKQYSEELEKIIATKNNSKESLNKLDDLQKQINEISNQKNKSDDVYNTIKTNIDDKEIQITTIESTNITVKQNLQEIKTELSSNEEELSKAKKKNKPILEEKINELKAGQIEKEKQIAENDSKIKILKNELTGLNDELTLANKIKTEKIATNNTNTAISSNIINTNNNSTAINTNTISNNQTQNKITAETLKDKYKDKIAITDNLSKDNINQSTTELKNFNKDIDVTIAKDKSNFAKAKTTDDKNKLTTEIKNLEDLKKQNQQQIIANNKMAIGLNTAIASNTITNATQTNQNLNPVTTTNNNDAILQLDKLNVSLNNGDVQNFDFNAYQNQTAQQLKIDADSKINDAVVEQKKLKEIIASAKDALTKTNGKTNTSVGGNTPQQFSKEAEDLATKSIEALDLSKTKTGEEKDKLIADSKELQNKSNEKNLQAAELTKNDNKAIFDTNKENLQILISENKSNEADNTEAKKLNEEAIIAYNQAKTIREEALSQPNIGAKLGGLSNAEEKEVEAINKQKQAVDLLKKSNETANLKNAITSLSNVNNSSATNTNPSNSQQEITQKLNEVNKNIEVLADKKLEAYQKLHEANKTELEQITANLKTNETTINATPALKSEYISGTSKISSAETFKQNSDADQNKNDKLTNLINSTKKQIEAINQLNKLNKKVEDQIAKNSNVANNNANTTNGNNTSSNNTNSTTINNGNTNASNTNDNNTNSNNTNSTAINNGNTNASNTNDNNTNSNNTNSTSNNNGNTNANTTNGNNTNGNNTNSTTNNNGNTNANTTNENNANPNNNTSITANTPTIDVNTLAKTDTTAAQTVTYFENKNVKLKNQQANTYITNSIKELKKIDEENKQLENTSASTNTSNPNEQSAKTATDLKTKSDELTQKAEDLSVKAFDTKSEANTKTGTEKDDLLAKAKEFENESNSKKIEATSLTKQANDLEYTTNTTAITEMLAKLKNDNPNLATVIEQKNSELTTLKTQANELRSEANNQSNISAKIGGLGNAEEKETELLQKQNNIINELKKTYPDYVIKPVTLNSVEGTSKSLTPEEITQKKTQLKEKQNTELTNLTNGFSLEYETNKTYIPTNLNAKQKEIKQNAGDLNVESKRLLIKSTEETNPNEKVKLLTLAAKTGNAAVEQLNLLTGNNALAISNPRNNNPRNNNPNNNNTTTNPRNNNSTTNNPRNNSNVTNTNTNPRNNNNTTNNNVATNNTTNTNPRNNNQTNTTNGARTVKIEGLEVTAGNAYNANKPIPVDEKIPDGLVFRVQIGAFKVKLQNDAFKGLSPVNGETVGNGYIRYTAGNFNKLENANAVKNDLRNLGYNDAFVVVYYNGKRIPLNEALALLEKEGKTLNTNAPQTAGITANANVPKANTVTQNQNVNPKDAVTVTKELEQIKNMLFTVQIGVYSKQVTKQQLQNLKPIYTERLASGLYRYTTGIYNASEKIITDKRKVVDLGIKDAFVSAYLDGKRIDFNDAKNRQQTDSTIKMEVENPIIFTDSFAKVENQNGTTTTTISTNNVVVTNIQPFKNNVTNYPNATPENGIKANDEGVCFKVQIGAYSKQVPNEVAAKFSAIKNWPIENKQINGLFIYNAGNYTESKFAKDLKEEAIRLGINDAFISVYRDGKKLFGTEAAGLMNK